MRGGLYPHHAADDHSCPAHSEIVTDDRSRLWMRPTRLLSGEPQPERAGSTFAMNPNPAG
ncbi:hypothetical protein O4159_10470 [Gordonia terrae]|uniref:hypothetical protein n=1 Tax=Gordonia hongkongensis TaxID=1701090 RepID=UPI0022B50746|nr:hypothetical protein [Gordonia terrae]